MKLKSFIMNQQWHNMISGSVVHLRKIKQSKGMEEWQREKIISAGVVRKSSRRRWHLLTELKEKKPVIGEPRGRTIHGEQQVQRPWGTNMPGVSGESQGGQCRWSGMTERLLYQERHHFNSVQINSKCREKKGRRRYIRIRTFQVIFTPFPWWSVVF